jgi:hypothetical protein
MQLIIFLIIIFRRKRRHIWVHEINMPREEQGEFYTLIPQLLNDEKRLYLYFRMTLESFDEILKAIRNDITKQFTTFTCLFPNSRIDPSVALV